jgi:uncharacterized membrane protein (DUF373 family)
MRPSLMARKDALKRPRGRPQDLVARLFDTIEDTIHIVVAGLLVIASAFVLWNAGSALVSDLGGDPLKLVTDILDNGLLLFIVAELLHTVQVTIRERSLVVEPFLVVALIAAVRRLLLVTAELATKKATFQLSVQGVEMAILLALILGITVSLVLYHRYHGPAVQEDR